ncbi:hypothetical protein [Tenacibaculum finnmarkense]|uniref:Uncharacterized protein n=1 Tax=Tenacibaculum finnmarkense genomovar finnmarkense TaxID=1458503 RepID=A0AAP1REJ3_9FLAO|nr:hypothetical protein [Tenacibaculum finnmarkense]MBE7652234.1 hypothetical protein [Tenacibaculum finnmarkense genomovar finnmarkense]MBE7694594.1 hypothetical protein [Tenacibaculum finnmarkense genomovar finnmarkense]MCD8426782.1 hypothetical protein [Tenacibaculum finnmarkense genomovar finnmarkense]MCG8730567.1 hypothetical protein [Tenacibaculum finnmarkense]MCG8750926.1 hypothetical protein [Tenacibaculum finnmarkense]
MKNLLITFVFVLISGVFTYAGNPVKKASKKTEAVESKEEVAITEFCTITHCRYRLVGGKKKWTFCRRETCSGVVVKYLPVPLDEKILAPTHPVKFEEKGAGVKLL